MGGFKVLCRTSNYTGCVWRPDAIELFAMPIITSHLRGAIWNRGGVQCHTHIIYCSGGNDEQSERFKTAISALRAQLRSGKRPHQVPRL